MSKLAYMWAKPVRAAWTLFGPVRSLANRPGAAYSNPKGQRTSIAWPASTAAAAAAAEVAVSLPGDLERALDASVHRLADARDYSASRFTSFEPHGRAYV